MRIIVLVIVFACAAILCPSVDARGFRGGSSRYSSSSRYSGSRYSSSRYSYSSRYRYTSRYSSRASTYRYRSLRSYRRYSRYSRTSYRYRHYGSYRTSVSAIGMGGVTMNKQALLLAGSVYVAHSMRPNLYMTSGRLITDAVHEYAVCSGHVRWNSFYKTGVYVDSESDVGGITSSNSSSSSSSSNSSDVSQLGNGTTDAYQQTTAAAAPLGSSGDVTYRYFLCPNDLMDDLLDDDDAFCCGPPGSQMCCDEADFWEQDVGKANARRAIGITCGVLSALAALGFAVYCVCKKCRCRCRCPKRRWPPSSTTVPPPSATTAVAFQRVKTSEPPGEASLKFHPLPLLPPAAGQFDQLPSHPPPPYAAM